MNDTRLFRAGASGGIIFVLMQMVAQGMIQVGGVEPSFTAAATEISDFFASRDPVLVQIGDYISALSFVAFIWFLGALRSALRDAEGDSGWLADVAFGCGLISSAISVIGGWSLAFFRVGNGLDPQTARLIFDLRNFAFASTWVMLAGMLFAVGAVAAGEALFGPGIAERLMDFFSNLKPAGDVDAFPELTDREREVLEQIAQGSSNAEIASRLSVSTKTVRIHASNIFSKLQVADRSMAIIRAREAGYGRDTQRSWKRRRGALWAATAQVR